MNFSNYGNFEVVPGIGRVTPITDKDQEIPTKLWDPHYTDRRFTSSAFESQTIFLDPEVTIVQGDYDDQIGDGLRYSYSDSFAQLYGPENVRNCSRKAAEEVGTTRSARFLETMLRIVLEDDTLWLGHLRAGVNRSNGYSYQIYGYRNEKDA